MATFIVQGRFSTDAIKGLVAKPEDRGEAVEKLTAACGGRLKDYYLTTGENDFLIIVEADDGEAAVVAGMVVAASGAVSHVTTTRAWTTAEFKKMAERAGEVIGAYKAPG
jgi:uncharacterized protein with GYD domain